MNWYWKVRMYTPSGAYYIYQIKGPRGDLNYIDTLQDFYMTLMHSRMIVEGVSVEKPYEDVEMLGARRVELYFRDLIE